MQVLLLFTFKCVPYNRHKVLCFVLICFSLIVKEVEYNSIHSLAVQTCLSLFVTCLLIFYDLPE